jgi:REP element-mobilizing transposase RayT
MARMRRTSSPNWGGKRKGAGRKRQGAETVAHRRRPPQSRHHPLHVTLRLCKGAPSLRGSRLFRHLRSAFAKARDRFGMRLAHYSVQGNHIHLIVEAQGSRTLSRGMQGLSIRIAKAVNRVHARRGRVFERRYYARPLTTRLQVRRALVYVLFNDRHHLAQVGLSLPCWLLDNCSSAREFRGFAVHSELPPPDIVEHETTIAPRSYLLRIGWQRHGLIHLEEEPARSRAPAGAKS